eukprot:g16490.t2
MNSLSEQASVTLPIGQTVSKDEYRVACENSMGDTTVGKVFFHDEKVVTIDRSNFSVEAVVTTEAVSLKGGVSQEITYPAAFFMSIDIRTNKLAEVRMYSQNIALLAARGYTMVPSSSFEPVIRPAHRRLSSSKYKPTKAGGTSGVLRRLVPVVVLACLGLVGTLIVLSASRLDDGFGYNSDGGSVRGGKDNYRVQKPLPPPPPPPAPPNPQELDNKGGEGQAAVAAATTPHPKLAPQPPKAGGTGAASDAGEGGRIGDGGGGGLEGLGAFEGIEEERKKDVTTEEDKAAARREERERERERTGRPKKSFGRIGDNDKLTDEAGIRKGYIQGQWKGGHLGEKIDTAIGDSSWNIATGAKALGGSNLLSAADFGNRPVIVNADQDEANAGGGGSAGEGRGFPMRWMPGQLTKLAELQQQQREEEEEEELGTVSRTRMLGSDAALLIICANRHEYLERTLNAVAEYHPGSSRGAEAAIPVVISQDGSSRQVEEAINRFKVSMAGRAHVTHVRHTPPPRQSNPYFKLSAHYKWALTQVFDGIDTDVYDWASKDKVIILEEDLEIAPDFFDYFSAIAPLLDSDETLMAVSAWNDNGQASHVKDNKALFRSDFFPGLGWMLPRRDFPLRAEGRGFEEPVRQLP